MREGRAPRLTLELALLKMASLTPVADLDRLLDRLDRMEFGAAPAATSQVDPQRAAPAVAEPAPMFAPVRGDAPTPPPEDRDRGADDDQGGTLVFPSDPPPSGPARPSAPIRDRDDAGPRGTPDAAREVFGTPALQRRRPEPDAVMGDGATGEPPPPPLTQAPALPLGRVRDVWPALVERVRATNLSVAAVLEVAEASGETKGLVDVTAPDVFSRDTLERWSDLIVSALSEALGGPSPPLRFTVRSQTTETARASDPFERLRALSQEHPFFRILAERFGAVPHFP
jgi:hypothetical protein